MVIRFILLWSFLLVQGPAWALEWRDLWQTPEQRAARQRAEQRSDELIEQAPDDQWRGHGYYQKGEFDKAAETFANAAKDAATDSGADDASYNQATALVRQGEYDAAIAKYNELLEKNPEHQDAKHNRDIAEKLKELNESSQQQNGQQGESGDASEQNQAGQPQDQPGSQSQPGQQNQQSDSSGSQPPTNQDQQGQSTGQQSENDSEVDIESGSEEAAAAAKEALEQASAAEGSIGDPSTDRGAAQEGLSEADQATEQWLRQIEDDPAGLLRRKLELNHQQQYPGVGNSAQPW